MTGLKTTHAIQMLLCAGLLLGGCGGKTEEIQAAIKKEIPAYLKAETLPATTTEENLSFYLPEESKVLQAHENNVTLETEYGNFVIFANPIEEENSKTNPEIVKQVNEGIDVIVDETIEDEKGFQYVYAIQHSESKEYGVYVGVGSVKVSALVKKRNQLQPVIKELIQVAKSVQIMTSDEADSSSAAKKNSESEAATSQKTEAKS